MQELKRCDQALESYANATGIIPDYSEPHYERGTVLQKLKRSEQAPGGSDIAITTNSHPAADTSKRGKEVRALKRFGDKINS